MIVPLQGILFTWTLKILKKILILIYFESEFIISGASTSPIKVTVPSAGDTINSSAGIDLIGSRKK